MNALIEGRPFRFLDREEERGLMRAINLQNVRKVIQCVRSAGERRTSFSPRIVNALSAFVVRLYYISHCLKDIRVDIRVFPCTKWNSPAALLLGDPCMLLQVFRFPSMGYMLTKKVPAAVLWDKLDINEKRMLYRKSFEIGARIYKSSEDFKKQRVVRYAEDI